MEEIAREKGVDLDAVEIWFADEARIGQKNKIARRWARRGTRPSAPSDQRTASTYIFGAICPKDGKAVGLILPKCNTEAMQLHLDEIAKDVERDATPYFCSTGPDGTPRRSSMSRKISRSYRCQPNAPNSTQSRMSGSSCATTGSQTGSF